MSTRIRTKTAWSFCLVFLSLSIATWAQTPDQTDNQQLMQDIRFSTTTARFALQTLVAQLGLKVIFDESLNNYQKVTIELHNITLESATRIILLQQNLAARLIDDKTIAVFRDNTGTSQKFAEYKQWPEKREIAFAQGTSHGETQNLEVHGEDFGVVLGKLAKSLKLNIVFHSWVEPDDKLTIDLRDLTAEQAIVNILMQKRCVARIVENNTIMVFRGTDANRVRFDVYNPWPSIIGEPR